MLTYLRQAWLVLAVALVTGAALAGLNSQLSPIIVANESKERAKAAKAIVPAADKAEELTVEWTMPDKQDPAKTVHHQAVTYRVVDASGKLIAWAVPAQGKGYSSTEPVKLLVAVTADGKRIIDYKVISSQETPGLGDKITRKEFRKRFEGKSPAEPLKAAKKSGGLAPNEVQAITGATISSQAVCSIIYNQLGKDGLIDELTKLAGKSQH